MNQRRIRFEVVLYAAALLLALAVRMANLGYIPLNNGEAELALQAQAAAAGENPLVGPHPAYLALTTTVFFLFGGSTEAARFFPALAGSLLVLLPLLFRRVIGKPAAVLLAVLIAFDPVLLAASRQGGSQSLAVFFVLLAFGLWLNRRMLAAAVATGLALLGGPGVWPGIFGLVLALWMSGALSVNRKADAAEEETAATGQALSRRTVLFAGLAAFIFVGTLFFALPNGMNAAVESLPAYLLGWAEPSGASLGLMLITLLFYEFFPLLFAGWCAVNGLLRRDPVDRFLLVWWAAALILIIAYPARSLVDLIWPVIPMWVLAARQIARTVQIPVVDRIPVIGQAVLSVIILTYVSVTTASVINNPASPNPEVAVRLGGALLLLFASTGLVAWGWSRLVALRGFLLGVMVILLVYTVSSAWDSAGHSGQVERDVWSDGISPSGSSLLMQTIDELNQWGPKQAGGLDIVVIEKPSPALRWLLRDYRHVTFVDQLTTSASPSLVITPERPELALAATYRGQAFMISNSVLWTALQPVEWFRWFVFRSIPANVAVQDRVILWARLDVFPVQDPEPAQSDSSQQGAESSPDAVPEEVQ